MQHNQTTPNSNSHSRPNLNIVVTGGNNGIGLQTIIELYIQGHNIIFGSRNQQKNEEALQTIKQRHSQSKNHPNPNPILKYTSLDLSKKSSIQQFSQFIHKQYSNGIDILINNAGLILDTYSTSQLGIQSTLTINHFGHFYLTYLLFDLLKKPPHSQSRIINVSSLVHYDSPDNMLQDLQCKNETFSSMTQYRKSKFFNVLWTVEMAKRISKYDHIKVMSLHPGVVASGFGSEVWYLNFFYKCCCCITVNSNEGARTSLHLATGEKFAQLRNGEYYHSDTRHREMDSRARDPKLGDKLWKISQEAYGIKFDP